MELSYRSNADEGTAAHPSATGFGLSDGITAACFSSLIDELDVGVLVCRASGRLVHANAAGRQELRWGRLLALRDGDQVGAADSAQAALLLDAMAAAAAGRRRLLQLRRDDERLMLAVQPLPDADGEATRVLLLLGRRSMAPGLVVEMLCRMHALTSAEQRVLKGLLHGQQVPGLATAFGVKVSTVRSQVVALRAKLGVRRITDALRLAAELPPMAGALRHQACDQRAGPAELRQ